MSHFKKRRIVAKIVEIEYTRPGLGAKNTKMVYQECFSSPYPQDCRGYINRMHIQDPEGVYQMFKEEE